MIKHLPLYSTIVNTMKELDGFSVIPLNGKKPHQQIKKWESWQRQRPSKEQIAEWFENKNIQAYAVITGSVSNGLFVIDFDKIGKYRRFKQQFPELATSYTVWTRRGRHVYLRTAVPVRGRRFKGGDIQAEGQYVVGPGSTVDGYLYKAERKAEIAEVNKDQLLQIIKWLTNEDDTNPTHTNTTTNSIWMIEDIQAYYQKQAPMAGRNNALYTAAARARAIGNTLEGTIKVLADQHTKTEPYGQHKSETHQQRYQEAIRTITSAYTGTAAIKPAAWNYKKTEPKGAIPNSLREAMLKTYNTTIPGRLLEACILEGWQPRQIFTMKAMQQIGSKYKIGDKQIREAVVGTTSYTNKHTRIYKPTIDTTSPPVGDTDTITKKGDFRDGSESKVVTPLSEYVPNYCDSEDGRTPQFFEFPDLTDLCTAFGVLPLASDVLEHNDLTSAKNYLMGLFRELVTRLSPEFSIQWHAERLGVSERTIYRYIAELGMVVTPIFEYVPLGWENVDDESLWQSSVRINQNRSEITPGQWVQRRDGKRFPAIQRVILDWLPRSSQELVMCYRRPSRLQLPQAGSPIVIPEIIWRRADLEVAPEWGGGQYDFPPVQRIPALETIKKPIKIAPSVNTTIQAKSVNTDLAPILDTITDIPELLGLSSRENLLGLLDQIPEEGLEARQRLGLATYEHLNQSLQLVSGLGKSRIDQLNDRGIFTLEQVILIGSERLFRMISWRGREYLSSISCEKWVEDAKILLGWKQLDPKVILEEKRCQEAQKAAQDYKKNVQRFIDYLKSVHEWEHEVFGTGEWQEVSWNKLLEWFMTLMRRVKADPSHLLDPRTVDAVHKNIREFCLSYQERIDLFLAKEDWELEEYVLGIRKKWKSLKRATSRQLIRFENNNIWTGWN